LAKVLQKRAFTIHVESFKPTVMFFGMTNSPATFQVMMNKILRDLINKGKVIAFVDDVLVRTETKEEYEKIGRKRFVCQAGKMCVKGKEDRAPRSDNKTKWDRDRERKMDGMLSWPKPKNIKDIRKFLGLVNYYRRFIKDFA